MDFTYFDDGRNEVCTGSLHDNLMNINGIQEVFSIESNLFWGADAELSIDRNYMFGRFCDTFDLQINCTKLDKIELMHDISYVLNSDSADKISELTVKYAQKMSEMILNLHPDIKNLSIQLHLNTADENNTSLYEYSDGRFKEMTSSKAPPEEYLIHNTNEYCYTGIALFYGGYIKFFNDETSSINIYNDGIIIYPESDVGVIFDNKTIYFSAATNFYSNIEQIYVQVKAFC